MYKDIDLCYKKKYKLSEIAKEISNKKTKIVKNSISNLNYIGNSENLYKYDINLLDHFDFSNFKI